MPTGYPQDITALRPRDVPCGSPPTRAHLMRPVQTRDAWDALNERRVRARPQASNARVDHGLRHSPARAGYSIQDATYRKQVSPTPHIVLGTCHRPRSVCGHGVLVHGPRAMCIVPRTSLNATCQSRLRESRRTLRLSGADGVPWREHVCVSRGVLCRERAAYHGERGRWRGAVRARRGTSRGAG